MVNAVELCIPSLYQKQENHLEQQRTVVTTAMRVARGFHPATTEAIDTVTAKL